MCRKGPNLEKNGLAWNLKRPDPCSVDFGRETPKFWFEFCCGFLDGFFLLFFPRQRQKNNRKSPAKFTWESVQKNTHRISAEAFSREFWNSRLKTFSSLENFNFDLHNSPQKCRNCLKHVQSNSVPSRLLPHSCLLNPGRGPKSNRSSRLFPGSF